MNLKQAEYVLGLSGGYTLDDAKRARNRLALKHHPDQHGNSAASNARMKEINEAYEVVERHAAWTTGHDYASWEQQRREKENERARYRAEQERKRKERRYEEAKQLVSIGDRRSLETAIAILSDELAGWHDSATILEQAQQKLQALTEEERQKEQAEVERRRKSWDASPCGKWGFFIASLKTVPKMLLFIADFCFLGIPLGIYGGSSISESVTMVYTVFLSFGCPILYAIYAYRYRNAARENWLDATELPEQVKHKVLALVGDELGEAGSDYIISQFFTIIGMALPDVEIDAFGICIIFVIVCLWALWKLYLARKHAAPMPEEYKG